MCPALLPLGLIACIALAQEAPSLPRDVVNMLRFAKGGLVVSLGKGPLETSLKALVREDALVDLALEVLPQEFLNWNPAVMPWVRSQAGASLWVVLDRDGRVVAQGMKLPRGEDLAGTLAKAGMVSPSAALRAFLRQHPTHQEARTQLIGFLHTKASQRTVKLLNLQPQAPKGEESVEATMSRWTQSALWLPEAQRQPLSPEQDVETWAPLAQELELLLRDPAWPAAPVNLQGYPAEAHSPMIQAIYQRHLPRLQQALAQHPASHHLWSLWVRFQGCQSSPPSLAFLQGLKPLPEPLGGRGDWPPSEVVGLLVADARKRGAWQAARDILWAQFEAEGDPEEGQKVEPSLATILANDAAETWQNLYDPLIEALVRTGQEGRALTVVHRVRQQPHLKNTLARLQELARRLGRRDLAAPWVR